MKDRKDNILWGSLFSISGTLLLILSFLANDHHGLMIGGMSFLVGVYHYFTLGLRKN